MSNETKPRSIKQEALDAYRMRRERDKVVARRVAQVNIDNVLWAFNLSRKQAIVTEIEAPDEILGTYYILQFDGLEFYVKGQEVYFVVTCDSCGEKYDSRCHNLKQGTSRQAVMEDIGEAYSDFERCHRHAEVAQPEPKGDVIEW